MVLPKRPLAILLFFWLVVSPGAAFGQSLAVTKQGEGEFMIEAVVPPDTRYVLQTSADLRLWEDINDQVSGVVLTRLDIAEGTQRFYRLTLWTAPLPPIKVVLLGDSTVADFASNLNWFNGWGQGIYGYFKPNVRVVNLAYPGHSTRRFLASDEKMKMIAIKPDFVLVEFGLIDEFGTADDQRTTLKEYGDNLKAIVQTIRDFNGTPILITPQAQRFFDENDKVIPIYQERYAVMKEVAVELETHLIDLNRLSIDLLNGLGKDGSEHLWWGTDYLHFSDHGAQVIAGLVVNAFPDSLKAYVVGTATPQPKP
jgi:lysophospholipase L1-like esterase